MSTSDQENTPHNSMAFPPSYKGDAEAAFANANDSTEQGLPPTAQGMTQLRAELLLRQLQQGKQQQQEFDGGLYHQQGAGGVPPAEHHQPAMMPPGSGAGFDTGELTRAQQQLIAAQRAIELGVTPEMLGQQQQQQQMKRRIQQQSDMSPDGGEEGQLHNFSGGGGVTPSLPPFGGIYGGGGGGAGQYDANMPPNMPGGLPPNMPGGPTPSSLSQEAAYLQQQSQRLQQQSQQLHNRQAQILAAASGFGPFASGGGGGGGPPDGGGNDGPGGVGGGYGHNNFYDQQPRGFVEVDPSHESVPQDFHSQQQQQFPLGMGGGPSNKKARYDNPPNTDVGRNNAIDKNPAALVKAASKKRAKGFPEKLMQAIDANTAEDAVAWLPDGKSFVIVDPDVFVENTLKTVFKGCKYSSFVRKLHRWNFVRLTSGTGTDCFHHPLFQQGRNDLCILMTCTPRNDSGPGHLTMKSSTDKYHATVAAKFKNDKPPSLVGIEKFIVKGKKIASAAAAAEATSIHTEEAADDAEPTTEEKTTGEDNERVAV